MILVTNKSQFMSCFDSSGNQIKGFIAKAGLEIDDASFVKGFSIESHLMEGVKIHGLILVQSISKLKFSDGVMLTGLYLLKSLNGVELKNHCSLCGLSSLDSLDGFKTGEYTTLTGAIEIKNLGSFKLNKGSVLTGLYQLSTINQPIPADTVLKDLTSLNQAPCDVDETASLYGWYPF